MKSDYVVPIPHVSGHEPVQGVRIVKCASYGVECPFAKLMDGEGTVFGHVICEIAVPRSSLPITSAVRHAFLEKPRRFVRDELRNAFGNLGRCSVSVDEESHALVGITETLVLYRVPVSIDARREIPVV